MGGGGGQKESRSVPKGLGETNSRGCLILNDSLGTSQGSTKHVTGFANEEFSIELRQLGVWLRRLFFESLAEWHNNF